jgi:GT2 family glycosyltransferase
MNSIIILNWNTTDLLINLFNSIVENSSNKINITILDNGSREEQYEKLLSFFSDYFCCQECASIFSYLSYRESALKKIVFFKEEKIELQILRISENIGFGAGNNLALNFIDDSKNVIFINSDILIQEKDWDKKFDEALNGVEIVGCAYHPLRWSADARFKILPKSNKPVESQSVQGAFFAIRKEILDLMYKEDGCWFDEEFKFAQYEETDLQFRILKKGYKCIWMPCAHLHLHEKSATKSNGYNLCKDIKNINEFKNNAEKNRLRLLEKHREYLNGKITKSAG